MEHFSMITAENRHYAITTPTDTRLFFADVNSMTTDGFLDQELLAFGCAPERLHRSWSAIHRL